jgi:general secretion pathway protein J
MRFKAELSDPSLGLGHAQAQVTLQWRAGSLLALTAPAPHASWTGPAAPVRETVLLDHLADAQFAYWNGSAWLSRWNGKELPRLVRIRLAFPPGDARHWPDIIAAPMREAPG